MNRIAAHGLILFAALAVAGFAAAVTSLLVRGTWPLSPITSILIASATGIATARAMNTTAPLLLAIAFPIALVTIAGIAQVSDWGGFYLAGGRAALHGAYARDFENLIPSLGHTAARSLASTLAYVISNRIARRRVRLVRG